VNAPEPDSAYMVYAGKSGATGGIEFDVFYTDDPEETFANASCEVAGLVKTTLEVSADDAVLATGLDTGRGGKWATITVRNGRLVFCISIPDSGQAQTQLIALSKIVLERTR